MISYEDALAIVLSTMRTMPEVRIETAAALGLTLTRPVRARMQMPRYDQSAMDGIAVHVSDFRDFAKNKQIELRLAGEMPAGTTRRPTLRTGDAIKVFTGSPIPNGCDAVVMVEYCEFNGKQVAVSKNPELGQHIRRAGEEIGKGDTLLEAGTRITPPAVGILHLFGYTEVHVRPWPTVGIITMGDELAGAGEKLGSTRIFDSNGPAITAALNAMDVTKTKSWRVDDDPRSLRKAMRAAITKCDVVVTVGGASVGDHDHVESVRAELGIKDLFARVAIKPGKPNVFGVAEGKVPIFSLPGNPVSALVSFHQFVRPGIRTMVGLDPRTDVYVEAALGASLRPAKGRLEWIRATLERKKGVLTVTPVSAQGSHMLSGLARSNALIEVPIGFAGAKRGEMVRVVPLEWSEQK